MALHRAHPKWSMKQLRKALPGLPRNSAVAYLRRYERVCRKRRRRRHRVLWNMPGTVWAIDGTWLERCVEGSGRRALIVVELHSKKTLALESVSGERIVEVERVLAQLIQKHGAPLVLKLDNGSAFISLRIAVFCALRGITLMHSPPRQPAFNGTCEVSGRWAKRRAQVAADLRGDGHADAVRPGPCGDLRRCAAEGGRGAARSLPRDGGAGDGRRGGRTGVALADTLRDHVRRSLGRVAARRALQACHILTIEGRGYRQWLLPSTA